MKLREWIILGTLLGAGVATACPDFGVAMKVKGGQNFAGLEVSVRAKGVTVKTPAAVLYSFSWKGTATKGEWCYDRHEDGKSTTTCQDPKKVNEEVPMRAKNGDILAVVRMYSALGKLSGTKETGALLAIVENGTPDPKAIRYETPWLRFVYSVDLKPATLESNDVSALSKTLAKRGFEYAQVKDDYAITHHLYADYFDKKDNGIIDGDPKVLGTLKLDKTEVPLAPIPRETPDDGEADLDGNHYVGKKGGNGCQSEVERIRR